MRFKKVKRPKAIKVGGNEVCVDVEGSAKIYVGFISLGPREAIRLACWLIRYAKWSSLE